ncbi:MAG: hypothetical protein EA357_12190 [Micavibrio sp.]|nr:MAG: hypothetical protein EA357_12190 [Micavibrio sp.]
MLEQDLNTLEQGLNLLEIIKLLVDIFIGGALVAVAWQANKIAKNQSEKMSIEEKQVYRDNYQKISKAIGLIIRDGGVPQEVIALSWQAVDEAELLLPEDIVRYLKEVQGKIFDFNMLKARMYDNQGRPNSAAQENWNELVDQDIELLKFFCNTKPVNVYRKYIVTNSKKAVSS